MYNYARARGTASRLITKFGQRVVLRHPGTPTGPSYDPTPGTPIDVVVTLVDLQRRQMVMDQALQTTTRRTLYVADQDGLEIHQDDLFLLPSGTDTVEVGGVTYTGRWSGVMEVRRLAPEGTVTVMWEVDVRS